MWKPHSDLSATATGSLPASGTAPDVPDAIDGNGQLSSNLTWTRSLHTVTNNLGLSVPAGGSSTQTVVTDGSGTLSANLTWPSTSTTYHVVGGPVGDLGTNPSSQPITVTGNGRIFVTLTWDNPLGTNDLDLILLDPNGVEVQRRDTLATTEQPIDYQVTGMTYPSSRTYTLRVVSKTLGVTSYTLDGSKPDAANLDLRLENISGGVLASSSQTAGIPERTLSYSAGSGTYVLRAMNSSTFPSSATLVESHKKLDYADLGLTLLSPSGATVTGVSSATGTLPLAAIATTPGDYTWRITNLSSDLTAPSYSLVHGVTKLGDATATGSFTTLGTNPPHSFVVDGSGYASVALTWGAGTLGTADLTAVLKGPAGQILGQARSATGSLSFTATAPGAGTHTVEVTNNSIHNVPSYTVSTTLPKDRAGSFTLQLKDASNNVVATGTGTKPKTLSTTVAPGNYTVAATPTGGIGSATLAGNAPAPAALEQITYDGNDHATVINDGTTTVTETLSPSGRVIRRMVRINATQAVTEDVLFGYDGSGDSPAYSKPTAGGALTTYLGGGGLSAIDIAGTVTYQHSNAHGDIVGTSDSAGAFTALPTPDEFGVGPVPGSRLAWLGSKERFSVGAGPGLMRMGVRLYEPRLGRFLQVDPVEGGCANDYAYVHGDPVNAFDLSGLSAGSCAKALGELTKRLFANDGALMRYIRAGRHRDGDPGHVTAFDSAKRRLNKGLRAVKQECGRRGGPPNGLAPLVSASVAMANAILNLRYPGTAPGSESNWRRAVKAASTAAGVVVVVAGVIAGVARSLSSPEILWSGA